MDNSTEDENTNVVEATRLQDIGCLLYDMDGAEEEAEDTTAAGEELGGASGEIVEAVTLLGYGESRCWNRH